MSVVLDDRRGRWGAVELARLHGLSWVSIFAGIFVAYAVFPVLLGVTGGIFNAINLDVDLSRTNWREVGVAAGIVAALLLRHPGDSSPGRRLLTGGRPRGGRARPR